MVVTAISNLALALLLTPELGVEGPALATTIPFVIAFPLVLRIALRATGVSAGELWRRAFMPAYLIGALLAAILLAVRLLAEPDGLVAVGGLAAGGVLGTGPPVTGSPSTRASAP